MALAIDGSVSGTIASGTIISGTISNNSAGQLILVLITNGGGISGGVTSTGLTFTQLANQNSFNADNGIAYCGYASGQLSSQIISASNSAACMWGMTILTFTGSKAVSSPGTAGIGSVLTGGNNTASTPSLSINTTANNSLVTGVIGIGSNVTMTPGANQTIMTQAGDAANGGHGATLKQNATTPNSNTSVAISVTNTNQSWNACVVEVLAAVVAATRKIQHLPLLGVG